MNLDLDPELFSVINQSYAYGYGCVVSVISFSVTMYSLNIIL